MIDHQDAMGPVGNILFSDVVSLVSEDNHCNPSPCTRQGSRLSKYLQGQVILSMIPMVSENPDV
jgi:hypothetical protein